ncbi:MAG: caspase family protein [Syntrophobacter sp.]
MDNRASGHPNRYALLIGIDCYLPNRLPDGGWYPNLGGCVRDISHVEAFLKSRLDFPQEHVFKLTASDAGGTEPAEPRENWPTYENIVAAFKRITNMAQSGDHIYIHYSGHGGRASTIYPEHKGANGIDEALVPTDIGNSEARYLRDLELAKLLNDMVAGGLVVAAVLDSCHSGGLTRGGAEFAAGVAVRGIGTVDNTPRPVDSLVGPREELLDVWDHMTEGGTRNVSPGSGWLPEPKGYTLFAACRPSESAFEYAFNGRERNGVLTYWLLDSLDDTGPGVSYKVLHDRIVAKVHSQFENQTPQLQGEGDRLFLGSERTQPVYAVPVMQVDVAENRVLLGAGQAHGLREGARFAVYPNGSDFSNLGSRDAIVEFLAPGATETWAAIIERFTGREILQGAQAVLLGAGSVRLVQKVWMCRGQEIPAEIDQESALRAACNALQGNGWVEVSEDGSQADYNLAVNENGEYEIWDRTGHPIGNLRPALRVGDTLAAESVARRLVHLTKYNAVNQLSNYDPMSPLARKLEVELLGRRTQYDPADPFEPEELFTDPGRTPTLKTGEWTAVRIRNAAARSLNITAFDLQPDWGITQIYPSGHGDLFVELDAGQEVVLPLRAGLPQGYSEGKDVVKVFATIGTTNFRWLELPALDQPLSRNASLRYTGPKNPLEELISTITADQPLKRQLIPAAYPSREWVTAQLEVHVKKM